jgi:hypothetical protein
MIKAEDTILKDRINLVDTDYHCGIDDRHLVRQISKEEAIYLLRSLLDVLIPEKDTEVAKSEPKESDVMRMEEVGKDVKSQIKAELEKDYVKDRGGE